MDIVQTEEKWMSNLKETLLNEGACKVGFGDLTALPEDQRKGMPRGISIAVPLDLSVVNQLGTGMTTSYHAEYNRTNALLNRLGLLAADLIGRAGYCAVPLVGDEVSESFRGHASLLPHKTVATRAGMGWIGRNALLVTKERGSAVRITSVLTDAPLPCSEPVNESSCADCSMCVRNCPGQAPLGPLWSVSADREDFLDVLACRKACVERSWRIAPGMSMCSLCVLVCPWTRKAIEAAGLTYGFPAVEMVQKDDLEGILALQKLAFTGEAVRYNDFTISPMVETIEDLTKEFSDPRKAVIILKMVQDRHIIASVRAYENDGTCHIGRMAVHPDYQHKGLGTRMMKAIESCYAGARFELFTGAQSKENILFYQSLGYHINDMQNDAENVTLIGLEK